MSAPFEAISLREWVGHILAPNDFSLKILSGLFCGQTQWNNHVCGELPIRTWLSGTNEHLECPRDRFWYFPWLLWVLWLFAERAVQCFLELGVCIMKSCCSNRGDPWRSQCSSKQPHHEDKTLDAAAYGPHGLLNDPILFAVEVHKDMRNGRLP